ncbi:invasion associated locus B family protein [Limimaricola cinnabarinus]|uniref:Invasion-associated locus B family protein n=1 Tax=Limimaricola cinnabarinus TaxID=1125964 RepID=A0A2G1MC39_9RHOB|nr:invasion associated locus B family protein [Limimaricola cinnabarinus]PHP26232.1 hypothetical protein CJ301_17495 [Limimaricola cinnabarinus]
MKPIPPAGPIFAALLSAAAGLAAAQEKPDYPEPLSRVEIGDWVVECFDEALSSEQCQIYQRILINGGTAIAMVTTMAYGADGVLSMQIALPLGIDLAEGAVISVADRGFLLPIDRCTKQGCLVDAAVPAGLMDALQGGSEASITVSNPSSGDFAIPLSLAGFGDALSRITPPPAPPSDDPAEEPEPSVLPEPEADDPDGIDAALAPVTGDG